MPFGVNDRVVSPPPSNAGSAPPPFGQNDQVVTPGPAWAKSSATPPPQQPGLLSQMGNDIGSAVSGAVDKLSSDYQAQLAASKANAKRPIAQTLLESPLQNLKDVGQMAGDVVNVPLSTVGGVWKAAARPVGNVVGGAASDIGVPFYAPQAGAYTKQQLALTPTRQQSQDNATAVIANALGLIGDKPGEIAAPGTPFEAPVAARASSTPETPAAKPTAGSSPRATPDAVGAPPAPAEAGSNSTPGGLPSTPRAALPTSVGNPAVELKAINKVLQMARSAGISPEAAGADTGLTTAENLGGGADGTTMALARREGTTKNALLGIFADRTATLPQRFEDAMTGSSGIDRNMIDGEVDKIASRAQAAAKPLYDQYEALPARTSPELDSLLATPHVRKALEAAETNAKNERAPAHEIQNIRQLIDGLPTDSGPGGDANDYLDAAREYQVAQTAGAAKALKRARGPSLTDFLASKGGVLDTGGEVAALDGDKLHLGRPFQRKLVTENGMGLDDAAQAAWEAGYFPHHAQAPEVPEFLDAMRRDIAGDKFHAAPKSEQEAMAGRVGDFETLLNHHQIDPSGKSAAQLAKEVADAAAQARSYQDLLENGSASRPPGSETISRQVPTPRALNDIKKVLDKDYIQREMAAEIKGQAPGDWSKDKVYAEYKAEVERLFKGDFDYKGMQAAGGDAPKIRQAFRTGKDLIDKNDVKALKAKTIEMSPLEKKVALAGWIRKVVDTATAKQGIPFNELVRYTKDDFAQRVAHMAGDPAVGARFQAEMKTILRERQGLRLHPNANSLSGDIIQGNKALDASGFGDFDGAEALKSIAEPKKAIMKAVTNKVAKLVEDSFTPGRVAQRNRLGELLADPAEFRKAYGRVNAVEGAARAAQSQARAKVAKRIAAASAVSAFEGMGGKSSNR